MKTSSIRYEGNLRTSVTHIQSGTTIQTDAPTDNNGKGEKFSPTDLLASSLASCAMTIMGIKAEGSNISLEGMTANVTKVMATEPRRVAEIIVEINLPGSYTDKEKQILERAALTCPVFHSLSEDLKKTINFTYGG